jgi:hypothetical protein
MKNVSTYTNVSSTNVWDFAKNPFNDTGNSNFWNINSSYNDGYPYLSWEYGEDLFGPTITQNSPPDNYSINLSTTITFNCSANDQIGLANISLYLINSTTQNLILNQTTNISGTTNYSTWNVTLTEGAYTWNCYSSDSLGNLNIGTTKYLYIDSIPPKISIISPANNTNSTNIGLDILYNVSDSNLISSCWYSNDSMTINTTLSNCGNITSPVWKQGGHNVTIWVNDSAGNINTTSLSFSIDSINPNLTIVYPTNNTNSTNANLNINYTVYDSSGLSTCWYTNDSLDVNYTLEGCTNITTVIWSDGQHNVSIWANDTFGNLNKTTIGFTVDSTAPYFVNISNQTLNYGDFIKYQINATDNTTRVSCFKVNDTTNFKINCSGSFENNTLLGVSIYWVNITVNDSFSNSRSIILMVNVSETQPPNVTLNFPIADYWNSSSSPFDITFNCSATDNYNLTNISLYLTDSSNANLSINQTNFITGTNNSSNWTISLSNGNYTWNCLAYDFAGNSNWEENRTIKINYTAVIIENSSGSSNAYATPTFYPTTSSLEQGYTKEVYPEWKVQIKISEENHIVAINKVKDKTVTITIYSTPKTKTLAVGEEWRLNLTDDKFYNLYIKVNSIAGTKVNISIKKINETITKIETKQEITGETIKEIKNKDIEPAFQRDIKFICSIIAMILLGLIIFIKIKKHNKRYKK